MYLYTKSINQTLGNKNIAAKAHAKTTTKSYLEAKIFEPCNTFKHVLSAPNTYVSTDDLLHTNNDYNENTYYMYFRTSNIHL